MWKVRQEDKEGSEEEGRKEEEEEVIEVIQTVRVLSFRECSCMPTRKTSKKAGKAKKKKAYYKGREVRASR